LLTTYKTTQCHIYLYNPNIFSPYSIRPWRWRQHISLKCCYRWFFSGEWRSKAENSETYSDCKGRQGDHKLFKHNSVRLLHFATYTYNILGWNATRFGTDLLDACLLLVSCFPHSSILKTEAIYVLETVSGLLLDCTALRTVHME
jgi:hypothetical protein